MRAIKRPFAQLKSASLFKHYSELSVAKKSALGFSALLTALVVPGAAFALQSNNDNLFSNPSSDNPAPLTERSSDPSSSHPALDSSSSQSINSNAANDSSSAANVNASVPPNSANAKSNSSVRVNGQNVPVPPSGNISKTIKGTNSKTEVDINIKGNGSQSNSSYTNIQINSSSSSTGTEGGDRFTPRR